MEPTEMNGSDSSACSNDKMYDEGSSLETSLENINGTKCGASTSSMQEKTIETKKQPINDNVSGSDIDQTLRDVPNDEEGNCERICDEDIKFQKIVQNLAEELDRAAKVIKEELGEIEKEVQTYKDLRETFEKISKDFDGSAGFKPKSLLSHQVHAKQPKQTDNIRHNTPTTPVSVKSTAEFSMTTINPSFYYKDAEKFCDQQVERVRKCISVSSINTHSADMGLLNRSMHAREPSLGHERAGNSMEMSGDDTPKRNLNSLSWRRQSLNSKYLDKKLGSYMERGDGGDKDTTYCLWPTTGKTMSN